MNKLSRFLTLPVMLILLVSCSGGGNGRNRGASEGTVNAPVTVTVENASTRKIGAWGTSYYHFMAVSNKNYTISLTNTRSDLSWNLYTDVYFTSSIDSCDNSFNPGPADEICTTSLALTAGADYYLSVDEWDNIAGTFTLLISEVP